MTPRFTAAGSEILALCRAALAAGDSSAKVAIGQTLLDMGQFADAKTELEPFCRAQPDNASAWSYLGQAREALGDQVGAEQAYRQAVDLEARGSRFRTSASGRLQHLRTQAH